MHRAARVACAICRLPIAGNRPVKGPGRGECSKNRMSASLIKTSLPSVAHCERAVSGSGTPRSRSRGPKPHRPVEESFRRHPNLSRKFVAQLDVDRQVGKATRRLNTRPSHDLADYVGDYDYPGYGRITITDAEGKLNWAYRGTSESLTHRHYDTFELPETPAGLLQHRIAISFSTDREGNIATLAARSSRSSRTSSSPAFQPAIARIRLPSALRRDVQPGSHDCCCRAGQRWTTPADSWEPTNLQTPFLPESNLRHRRA